MDLILRDRHGKTYVPLRNCTQAGTQVGQDFAGIPAVVSNSNELYLYLCCVECGHTGLVELGAEVGRADWKV